ncbi:hypothetical protein [Streptomyces sp. NPDC058268]|uniref:hypothetical protein n=1 Tax=Streptomyces sp. NPDC058268 TaxID=3346413 RepID=UPI0036F0E3B3
MNPEPRPPVGDESEHAPSCQAFLTELRYEAPILRGPGRLELTARPRQTVHAPARAPSAAQRGERSAASA